MQLEQVQTKHRCGVNGADLIRITMKEVQSTYDGMLAAKDDLG